MLKNLSYLPNFMRKYRLVVSSCHLLNKIMDFRETLNQHTLLETIPPLNFFITRNK
jgi:hypothetical protein